MALISINLKDGTIQKEQTTGEIIVGIDLGTTNSLVAYMHNGEAKAVRNKDGKSTLVPSIVHFKADGTTLVGDAAREMVGVDPANTIYSVKRLMGKSYNDLRNIQEYIGYEVIDEDKDSLVKIKVKDKYYTPIELSALILVELKQRIEAELQQPVSKAVITVPAYFNDAQRQATRDAGRLAGLDVLRIVNEPTAASLAYGISDKDTDEIIAVYDLGGGTFDISILQIQDGVFEVLSTNGDTFLGGDDFDNLIVEYFKTQQNVDAEAFANDKIMSQQYRIMAEAAKKKLSSHAYFEGDWNGQTFTMERSDFETLALPLVVRTIESCKRALSDAKLQISDIQHIVMVGGSTRMPIVKEKVSDFFGKGLHDKLNPDEVVALGAAIQADILAGNQKEILLIDITPLSLGIETVGGLMDVIIPRNSKVPSKLGRQYTTSVDGQSNLKIAVFQGERDLVQHNRKLGEFILKNIPPMPAGLPKIEIQFMLNADGILKVKAKELRSEVEQEVEIRSQYGISEEEMGMMLMDSIRNAQTDMAQRGILEARNEGQHIVQASEKFLKQHQNILSENEINETKRYALALNEAIKNENKDNINEAIKQLNDYTAPLAHRAMDATIASAMRGKTI